MTILVAVSRTHLRDHVLDVGIHLARNLDRELRILHLYESEGSPNNRSEIRTELRERVVEQGVTATVTVEPVDPPSGRAGPRRGRELLARAADADVTHIVMGHASRGLLESLAEGNTAFTVADAAEVPVTIVPESSVGST